MFEDEKPLSAEAEGKTVDEAVRKALIATGWPREQVTVEVLDHGQRSAWVSASVVRVRISRKTADALALAREVTTELLKRIGIPAHVEVDRRPDHIRVHVRGDQLEEVLLGQDGEPLDALQHLVARIVSKQSASRQMVSVDLGGFRERRERELRDLAYQLADQVRESGEQILTEPMGASERRIIHLALNEDPDITTFAVGDGLVKQIAIAPIDQAPPPEERRSADRRPRGGHERERSRTGDRDRGRGGDRYRRERGPGGRGSGRGREGGPGSRERDGRRERPGAGDRERPRRRDPGDRR